MPKTSPDFSPGDEEWTLHNKIIREKAEFLNFSNNGDFVPGYQPKRYLISSAISSLISEAGGKDVSQSSPANYNEILQEFKNLAPENASKYHLANIIPPKKVHMMSRATGVVLDLKNCDTIEESLHMAGFTFSPGQKFLDFGCSTGRTVRTMALALPDTTWHGCDPIETSISWAGENIPISEFFVSPQEPPMPLAEQTYNGVVALSVWSHFSPVMALEWINEMHRLIQKGGFLLLTTRGYQHVAKMAINGRFKVSFLSDVYVKLKKDGFFFNKVYEDVDEKGMDVSHWGQAFFDKDWLERNLDKNAWSIEFYGVGRWGGKQDIYILKRL